MHRREGPLKITVLAITYLSLATFAYADNPIYAVQILMAKEYENAIYEYEKLKDHHEVRIEKINNAYFVRIGAYQAKTKALSSLKQLKMTYTDAFLIKYTVDTQQIRKGNYLADQQKAEKSPPLPSGNIIAKNPDISTHLPTRTPISTVGKNPKSIRPLENVKPSSDIPNQSSEISNKLPEPQKLPAGIEEDFLKAGIQNYHQGNNEGTVSSLSKYASLTPKSQQRAAALLIVGKSLEQMKRPKSALGVYSRVIEQYPDSPESLFSIVAMADISVNNPHLHYPIGKKGAEYVRDPISAYDTVLLKKVPLPMIEHIQYQKGLALWKLKRYEQAREAQIDFLKKFPNTAYRKEVIVMLKDGTAILINQYSGLGDHISVANLFIHGWKNRLITTEDVETLSKSFSSLSYLGLHDDSLNILSNLTKSTMRKTSTDLDKAVAEIEKKRAIGLMSQLPTDAKWNKFQSGRAFLSTNNITKAEQTFSDLKNSDGDPFWSKITEYALEEDRWKHKYRAPAEK
jgi:tetratricopeptide (TPR) repeat protein